MQIFSWILNTYYVHIFKIKQERTFCVHLNLCSNGAKVADFTSSFSNKIEIIKYPIKFNGFGFFKIKNSKNLRLPKK